MYDFRLERSDGSPADPPTYRSTVLRWQEGDTIPLGGRSLRVLQYGTTTQTSRRSWWSRTCLERPLAPQAEAQ